MKKMQHVSIIVGVVVLGVSLVGYINSSIDTDPNGNEPGTDTNNQVSVAEMFSDRDLESGYDETSSTIIDLLDDAIEMNNESVTVTNNIVTISQEGTYILRGSLSDGQILIDAKNTDTIHIVLDTVEISNSSTAPIYVKQADMVLITLANNSKNTIAVHGKFVAIDEASLDAAIFSKEDLTMNGNGSLTIMNEYGNGITSKDDLVITNGTYEITASGHGLEGKDSIRISNGEFTIVSGKDGIHSENSDDNTLGYIFIQNGSLTLTAEDDGIHGTSLVQIDGGHITIPSCAEGIEGRYVFINGGTIDIYATDDAINATSLSEGDVAIEINGGDITIVMASGDTDAIDSNGDIYINGGTLDLTCGSSFDSDGMLVYNGGTVVVNGETVTDLSSLQMSGKRHP